MVGALMQYARLDMLSKQRDPELVERGTYGDHLLEDLAASTLVVDHFEDANNLAVDAVEAFAGICSDF